MEQPPSLPKRPDIERKRKINAALLKFYGELPNKEFDECHKEITDRLAYLEKKYPDARDKMAVFHDLMGSTLGSDAEAVYSGASYEDFPDDDSVEKFVDKLSEKYKGKFK